MPRFKRYEYGKMAELAADTVELVRPERIAIDTETSGFAWHDEAFCATVSFRDEWDRLFSFYIDLDFDDHGHRLACLQEILADVPVWIFHNAKFDLQKLELALALYPNWRVQAQIEDTAILHALLDENDRHGLKYLAGKLLGENTNEEKVLAKVRRKLKIKKDDGYHLLPREVVVPYAMKDTEFTLRLWEKLRPQLPDELQHLYAHELAVSLALLDIEGHGIGLDVPYLRKTASEYGVRLMKLSKQLSILTKDEKFNPNSPKQILEAFEARGVTVEATDKATLATVNDELATVLLDYRHVKKMHATYLTGMLNEQVDGVIHPSFNTTLPRTGRMSSSTPTNN